MGIWISGMRFWRPLFRVPAGRRLFAQRECFRCCLARKPGAEFSRGAQYPALWQMARLPGAQLLAKHMDIIAGLGSKAVFDGPYLFQKGFVVMAVSQPLGNARRSNSGRSSPAAEGWGRPVPEAAPRPAVFFQSAIAPVRGGGAACRRGFGLDRALP